MERKKAQGREKRAAGMSAEVSGYLMASYAPNTREAYEYDLKHFLEWGGRIPAKARMVAEYLAAFAGRLANSTLSRRLAAIKLAHEAKGVASPTSDQLVRATLRGIVRKHRRVQRRVAPLLRQHVVRMVKRARGVIGARDSALLLVGFAGAFRRSELVDIEVADLEFVRRGVVVTLRHSKTDQEGVGRRVAIPYAKGGVCAVRALKRWLEAGGIREGKVFRAVNRHGTVSRRGLDGHAVGDIIKKRAAEIGLDPKQYAGHSLRAGLVTSAARAGVMAWKIRQQTGHRSDAMLNRYIRDDEMFDGNAAGSVL